VPEQLAAKRHRHDYEPALYAMRQVWSSPARKNGKNISAEVGVSPCTRKKDHTGKRTKQRQDTDV